MSHGRKIWRETKEEEIKSVEREKDEKKKM